MHICKKIITFADKLDYCVSMKRNIAIIAGGDSSEYEVSLRSAAGIESFLADQKQYTTTIVLLRGNDWKAKVSDSEWAEIDKNDFSYTYNGVKHTFDFAYITIHGTPGENGVLQGYLDMIGLPYSCCGVLAAAMTFNKYTCNHYLKGFGVKVAESVLLRKEAMRRLGDEAKGYILTGSGTDEIISFSLEYPVLSECICTCDPVTLKTIVRANPGVVVLQNGVVIDKYNVRNR